MFELTAVGRNSATFEVRSAIGGRRRPPLRNGAETLAAEDGLVALLAPLVVTSVPSPEPAPNCDPNPNPNPNPSTEPFLAEEVDSEIFPSEVAVPVTVTDSVTVSVTVLVAESAVAVAVRPVGFTAIVFLPNTAVALAALYTE